MSGSKIALICIGALLVMFALAWLVQGNEFFMYKVFAPARENVGREVFENTKSYRRGLAQEIRNMQFQYENADDAHKEALASVILHQVGDDEERLPTDLQLFVSKLRNR